MRYSLSQKELEEVLSATELSDLHPLAANCMSVAAGIGQVVENDGYIAAFGEGEEDERTGATDKLLHSFVIVNGGLFDATGKQYDDPKKVVNIVHSYCPFGDRYKPQDFPLRSLRKSEIDSFLFENYVIKYEYADDMVVNQEVMETTASRIRKTIEKNRN